jgi:hypothetical protein
MRHLVVLLIHFLAILVRLLGAGGVRSLVAESLLLKHQLLIVNRSRQRSPKLSAWDRILAGLLGLLVLPARLFRSAIVVKPSTLLGLHKALCKRKYRMLFSQNRRRKPGPKGPSTELIRAVVEMKLRNPNWGCPRIAQQMALAFHIPIDKDVVRRILAQHYRPGQDSGGPSRLTFLGHMKDSLWSPEIAIGFREAVSRTIQSLSQNPPCGAAISMKARRARQGHGGNVERIEIGWSVKTLSDWAVDGEPGTPKGFSTRAGDQAVLHEGKNLKLFAHLTTEAILDGILGPFKQLGIPGRTVIQGDRWDSAKDIVRTMTIS